MVTLQKDLDIKFDDRIIAITAGGHYDTESNPLSAEGSPNIYREAPQVYKIVDINTPVNLDLSACAFCGVENSCRNDRPRCFSYD